MSSIEKLQAEPWPPILHGHGSTTRRQGRPGGARLADDVRRADALRPGPDAEPGAAAPPRRPMRALAEAWECDPSYATIVDRLRTWGWLSGSGSQRPAGEACRAHGEGAADADAGPGRVPPAAAGDRRPRARGPRGARPDPVEAGALSCDGTRADDTQRPACAWIAAGRTAAIGASSSRTIVSRALPELTPGFSW